jgi:hypothetical protein
MDRHDSRNRSGGRQDEVRSVDDICGTAEQSHARSPKALPHEVGQPRRKPNTFYAWDRLTAESDGEAGDHYALRFQSQAQFTRVSPDPCMRVEQGTCVEGDAQLDRDCFGFGSVSEIPVDSGAKSVLERCLRPPPKLFLGSPRIESPPRLAVWFAGIPRQLPLETD